MATMKLKVEVEREKDGRWIAEIRELPGCLTYGNTCNDALDKVKALALRSLADGGAGWTIKKQRSILRQILTATAVKLARSGFTFSDGEIIAQKMLSRICERTGLKPEDL